MRLFSQKAFKTRMDVAIGLSLGLLLTSVSPEPVEGHRHYVIDFIQSDSASTSSARTVLEVTNGFGS
jgi:hypothetical protein